MIKKYTLSISKLICLFLFGLSLANNLSAQSWCPPGATWYSEAMMEIPEIYGYDRAIYSGDTVINGQACKKICDTAHSEWCNNCTVVNPPLFTYSSGDTVYFLNHGTFLPYFYFNARRGDTLLVPSVDSIVTTYVDSTGMDTLNSVPLRLYTFRIPGSVQTCVPHDTGLVYGGMVIERLGFFAPSGQYDNSLIPSWSCFESSSSYSLHCYYDDSLGLYSFAPLESCDYIYTGIAPTKAKPEISIEPNPAGDYCNLHIKGPGATYSAALFDITGREILQLFSHRQISSYTFSTDGLAPGLYFVKLSDEEGRNSTSILVKE